MSGLSTPGPTDLSQKAAPANMENLMMQNWSGSGTVG